MQWLRHELGSLRFFGGCFVAALMLASIASADSTQTLGQGVAVQETTSMKALLADPDAFIGKTVRVEGEVIDVCPRKGCWVEISDADNTLRIKVQDDVIVFPADSVGRPLVAEGVVEAVEQTRQQHLDWLAHLAEERGESFDPESADIGDGPYRWIQIQGTGAELAAAP